MIKFEAKIEDRVISTKVIEKAKARERFEDAVAAGKAAVIAEKREKTDETMVVKLGNLLPDQAATIKATFVSQIEILAGHYAFILPPAFYPDYMRHSMNDEETYVYDFQYEVVIHSDSSITNLSIPEGAMIA